MLRSMIRHLDEAQDRLAPYADGLRVCVTQGIDEYRSPQNAALRTRVSKRSDSSNINDLIWAQLREEFEGEFMFTDKRNRRLMHIDADFNMRVKKLDGAMRPHSIPTQLVLDFLQQLTQLAFPGMRSPTNIDLGYQLTGPAETGVRVCLRCPRNDRDCHWIWELDEPATGVSGIEPAAQPLTPTEPPRRVRPRREETALEEPADGPPTS